MSSKDERISTDYRDSKGNSLYYTVDEAISKVGPGPFHWRLLFLTGLIWGADAMEMMLLTFLVPILKDKWDLKSPYDGMISFVVFFGMLLGTITFSILSDRIGRRKVVLVCNICCAFFGTLSGIVPDIFLMLLTRFFVGFFIGGAAVAYTLFAEYCPAELRGSLLIIEQGFWSVGALFSVFLAWICLEYLNWRWYLILCSVPLWIVSVFYKWIPESSRYLLAIGKIDESKQLLKRLAIENRGSLPKGKIKPMHPNYQNYQNMTQTQSDSMRTDVEQDSTTEQDATTTATASAGMHDVNANNATDTDGVRVVADAGAATTTTAQLREIGTKKSKRIIDNERTAMIPKTNGKKDDLHAIPIKKGSVKDVFAPVYRHTSILLLIAFFCCVFSYYGISFISERYFESLTDDSSDSSEYWYQAIATGAEVPGLVIAALWLDKVGRKNAMIGCFLVFTLCCIGLYFDSIDYYKKYLNINDFFDSMIGLTFVFFGRLTIFISFIVLFVYYSEYYPTLCRTTALGLASGLGRIGGMGTSFVSADLPIKYGMLSYAISGFIAFLSCILLKQDTTGLDMSKYSDAMDIDGSSHDGTQTDNETHTRKSYELIDKSNNESNQHSMEYVPGRLHGTSISMRKSISAVLKYSLSYHQETQSTELVDNDSARSQGKKDLYD